MMSFCKEILCEHVIQYACVHALVKKLHLFILSIVQSINIFTDISLKTYNETLFGVLLVHNAHFLILSLKCVNRHKNYKNGKTITFLKLK